ncbi:MAG: tetratricopeptide repeat protein, partial [Dehalococcoidia bacterium]
IYGAIAHRLDGEGQRQALWGLAQTYLDLGEFDAAAEVFQALLDRGPDGETARRAHYLRGLALSGEGRDDDAIAAFRTYIEGEGPVTPYARIQLAGLLAARGEHGEAASQLEAALDADLPLSVLGDALLSLGRARAATGDGDGALTAYGELVDAPAEGAAALWELAALYRQSGDEASRRDALRRIVRDYPWQAPALDALDELAIAGAEASPFERAVVLFEQGRNDEAAAAFGELLAGGPAAGTAGQAHYYLGLLAEREGDREAALSHYEESLAADRDGPLAPDAAWWRAQLLEQAGRLGEAAGAYIEIADRYPQSQRATAAVFRAGLSRYRQGDYAAASLLWERYLELAADPIDEAQAYFWLGRAALARGDRPTAEGHLRRATAAAPDDYYGLRARALLEQEPPPPATEPPPAALPPPDWPEVEAWLAGWAGPEDTAATQDLSSQPRGLRGQEMAQMGLGQEAAAEFAALIEDAAAEPWLLYRLARALHELGQTPSAARAAARLLQDRPDAPRALLAVAYPQDFLPLVVDQADRNDLSPLLFLALIRQESLFDPKVGSIAGALGLTQVIPSTGREIARELKLDEFEPADLLRPQVNLRFGAHYLASQLELFDGDPVAALAAYNGGPGNAIRWREMAPDEPDLFVEVIDLDESRAFVRIVMANLALYRYLFSASETRSLPLG